MYAPTIANVLTRWILWGFGMRRPHICGVYTSVYGSSSSELFVLLIDFVFAIFIEKNDSFHQLFYKVTLFL